MQGKQHFLSPLVKHGGAHDGEQDEQPLSEDKKDVAHRVVLFENIGHAIKSRSKHCVFFVIIFLAVISIYGKLFFAV